jgi:hypothetical protein
MQKRKIQGASYFKSTSFRTKIYKNSLPFPVVSEHGLCEDLNSESR